MRQLSILVLCASAAACEVEQPVVIRAEHAVEPLRTHGPAYADCTFAKYYGDSLSAVGTYDALGNLVYSADCFNNDLPIRIFETSYSGSRALVTQTAFWQSDEEAYEPYPERLRTWDGDLLIAEEEGDWEVSYHYDDEGKLLLKRWGDPETLEEQWDWQATPDGDEATATIGDERIVYQWDPEGRLATYADGWTTAAYTWDGHRLAASVLSYEDGEQTLFAYDYDEGGRLDRVDVNGELQHHYEWTCR